VNGETAALFGSHGLTTRRKGATGLRYRARRPPRRIEEIFGWLKTIARLVWAALARFG
jgi:hypothetical protein